MNPVDLLKLLADPARLRLFHLVHQEELSVAELQEITGMSQSRVSGQLALFRQAVLVQDRREGKKSFYSRRRDLPREQDLLVDKILETTASLADIIADRQNLRRVLEIRRQESEAYFNLIAGRLGRNYCPGRSWEAIGHFLLHLFPRQVVADLGAGEGLISQLLARRAEHVYCVDNSPKMVEVGRALAQKNQLDNLEYLMGDIEKVPLPDQSVDLALFSQALHHARHPETALREAWRILRNGGRICILDLAEHSFEKARELYADIWLGFSTNHLYQLLQGCGFQKVEVTIVTREVLEPHFETLLAVGSKNTH